HAGRPVSFATVKTRALLFDFDGVLVNTEPLHMQSWLRTLHSLSISFGEKDYNERYIGLNDRDFLAKVLRENNRPASPTVSKNLIGEKEEETRRHLIEKIPVMPGADDFIKRASQKYAMAIVTGALKQEVFFILDQLRWRDYFLTVVTADDVTKGKPDPEGYLKAFEFLRTHKKWDQPLEKKDCFIYEDSATGLEAARRSGIPFQQVFNGFTGVELP
ncbi:MAG: HAD family phosphatase, partial [Deltaproteobacteria bacterium]|nr:HAD family phosphatase [Deltaproteobacteria bacterium]